MPGVAGPMRLQPIAALVMMAGLLPALGCRVGGISAPGPADAIGLWGPEIVAAPHPRFHAAPTRPVFAPPLVEFIEAAAPPGALDPALSPELLTPPPSAPSPETESAAPDAAAGDLPEPGILPPPETPLPRASSRRVPGMEYF